MRPKKYARSKAVSATEIKRFLSGSPFSFHYHKYIADNNKPSDALIKGSYMHHMWLEPDLIKDRYFVMPKVDKRSKDGKNKHEAYLQSFAKTAADNDNLSPICQSIVDDCKEIYDALKDHPIITDLLSIDDKIVETPIYKVKSPVEGVNIKCIPDFVSPQWNLVADFKHMKDISESQFAKDAINYGYHIQAALNMMCAAEEYDLDIDEVIFEFICISKEQPYECARYTLSDDYLRLGSQEVVYALEKYKECLEKDNFPSYPTEGVEIQLPAWAKSRLR